MKYLLFILMSLDLALAQTENPVTIPPGPYLKRAPDYSTWTISFKSSSSGVAPDLANPAGDSNTDLPPVKLKQITVVKTAGVIYEDIIDGSDQEKKVWHNHGLQILLLSGDPSAHACPDVVSKDIYTNDYSNSDFAGLDWINASNYTGTQRVGGRDCLVFKSEVSQLTSLEQKEYDVQVARAAITARIAQNSKTTIEVPSVSPPTKVMATAYIDAATRLPVEVVFGTELRTYEFGQPPTSMLQLPRSIASVESDYQKTIQRLSAQSAAP